MGYVYSTRTCSPTRALFKVFYWCLFAGVRAFIRQSRVVSDSRESRANRVARRAVGSAARLDSTRPVSTRLDPMPRPLPIAAARLMTRRALLSKMNDDDYYDDDYGFFFSSPFSWIIVGATFMILPSSGRTHANSRATCAIVDRSGFSESVLLAAAMD